MSVAAAVVLGTLDVVVRTIETQKVRSPSSSTRVVVETYLKDYDIPDVTRRYVTKLGRHETKRDTNTTWVPGEKGLYVGMKWRTLSE